jgi:hypothetical protein
VVKGGWKDATCAGGSFWLWPQASNYQHGQRNFAQTTRSLATGTLLAHRVEEVKIQLSSVTAYCAFNYTYMSGVRKMDRAS